MNRLSSQWVREGFTREWWKAATHDARSAFLDTLTEDQLDEFAHDWRFWARDKQLLPDGSWHTALLLCGRGFGKTRTGTEWIQDGAREVPGSRSCLLGPSQGDVRAVMIEGDSGLLAIAPKSFRPTFYPSLNGGELHWPNGSVGYVFSSEDPESLRGPQFHRGWVDEPMAMAAKNREAAISNMMFGMRLGALPKVVFTTTPKPHRWLTELMDKIERDKALADRDHRAPKYIFVRGSTFENDDLPAAALQRFQDDYAGTNLGRQELEAEIIGDEQGALWTPKMLDDVRILNADPVEFAKGCNRVVVAVDPNVTSGKAAHAAGIVVCGARAERRFVLADRSIAGGPLKWAKGAVQAAVEFGATEIVAEVNNGGELVRNAVYEAADALEVEDIKVHMVRAKPGKVIRAAAVAAAYDRQRIQHVGACGSKHKPGPLYNLEVQMCAIHELVDPTGEDFDRVDALVWGMKRLGLKRAISAGSGAPSVGIMTFEEVFGGDYPGPGHI